jgi:pectin methylesterase-like acyl-CoA thioesterase
LVYKVGAGFFCFEVMRMSSWQRRDILKALIAAPVAVTSSAYIAEAQYLGPAASRPRSILGHTNPREAPFTAMGDGIEDNTKAVQGAIDAAIIKTRGGGVFIPAGTYKISTTLHI